MARNVLVGSNGSHEIMNKGLQCDMIAYERDLVVGV